MPWWLVSGKGSWSFAFSFDHFHKFCALIMTPKLYSVREMDFVEPHVCTLDYQQDFVYCFFWSQVPKQRTRKAKASGSRIASETAVILEGSMSGEGLVELIEVVPWGPVRRKLVFLVSQLVSYLVS